MNNRQPIRKNKEASAIRLNRYIAASGFCSRREADQLILDERITVNGEPGMMGMYVQITDRICIDGEPIRQDQLVLDPSLRRGGKDKEQLTSEQTKKKAERKATKERIQRNVVAMKTQHIPGGRQGRFAWRKGMEERIEEDQISPKKFYNRREKGATNKTFRKR